MTKSREGAAQQPFPLVTVSDESLPGALAEGIGACWIPKSPARNYLLAISLSPTTYEARLLWPNLMRLVWTSTAKNC